MNLNKLIRSRRGQFYIFAAVLLSIVAFTMVKPKETSLQRDDTFETLYTNYLIEVGRVVDNALLDRVNIQTRFQDFNDKFKIYSNSRNIKFGFLGIISASNATIVDNRLNSDVELNYLTTTETLSKNNIDSINITDQLFIEYNDIIYTFSFTEELTEVKGLFYAKDSNYEKIYVYD